MLIQTRDNALPTFGNLPLHVANVDFRAVQTCANLVELAKCCQTHILLVKIGFDTAENATPRHAEHEPTKVSKFIHTQAIQFHISITSLPRFGASERVTRSEKISMINGMTNQ